MDKSLAQALVDAFAALGLLAYALRVGGRGPASLRFAFLLGGLFYLLRGFFHATGWAVFEALSLIVAGALPLGALVLAEALLRRHAPRALKLAVLVGAVTGLAAVVFHGRPWVAPAMAVYVVGAFAAILALVAARDRAGLTAAENAALGSVSMGLLAVALLSVTDFLPAAPIGLSGIGALALVYAASGASAAGAGVVSTLGVAAALALGASAALDLTAWTDRARLAAVGLAALGALAILLRLQAGGESQRRASLLRALARADDASLAAFVSAVTRHPTLADLDVLEGPALAAYDAPALVAAFARSPVLSAAEAADPVTPGLSQDAREQLRDLLARHAATHAVLVSAEPLRLALLALGATRAGDDEAELLIFQRLAAHAARSGA